MTCIVIVHNGEAYLHEAIDSVLSQSMTDWELIIADDGSVDASRDIARRHARADSRIRLVTHADGLNHGTGATRNLGISESRGDFVGFLDADDVWEPTKAQEQLELFRQHPEVAMVYGRTLIWHSWDGTEGPDDFFYDLGVQPDQVHVPPLLFRNLLRNVYQTPTTCNALMRRSAIATVGTFDESFAAMFEDQLFYAKILLLFPVLVSDRCWARYRQHGTSTSARSETSGELATHIRYLESLRQFVAEQRRSPSGHRRVSRTDQVAVERMLVRLRRRHLTMKARRTASAWSPW